MGETLDVTAGDAVEVAGGGSGADDIKRGANGAERTIAGSTELVLLIGLHDVEGINGLGHRCLDLSAKLEIYDELVSEMLSRKPFVETNLSRARYT